MDGVDRHASRLGQRIRVAARQIDGANCLGLIRWQVFDERQEAVANLMLIRHRRGWLCLQQLGLSCAITIEDHRADDAVEPGVDTLGVVQLVEVRGPTQQRILKDVIDGMRIRNPAPDEGAKAIQIGQQSRVGLALRRSRHGIGSEMRVS